MSEVEQTPEQIEAARLAAEQAAAEKAEQKRLADEAKARKKAEEKALKDKAKADATAAKAKEAADKKLAKAEADAAKKKQRESAKLEKNGISRPMTGVTKTVWEIADKISQQTKAPAERSAVAEEGKKQGIQEGTINTQYGRWRRFHGLSTIREVKPKVVETPAPEVPATGAEIPPAVEGVDVAVVEAPVDPEVPTAE